MNIESTTSYRLRCAEVWGGIHNADTDACSAGLTASLFNAAYTGGKGGDIYYLSVCGSDRLTRVAVADVVGHGPEVSGVSQWLYDSMLERMNDPAGDGVLNQINRVAADRGIRAMTTAAIVSYYLRDHCVRYTYAGHYPALVLRRGERRWEPLDAAADEQAPDPTGPPLAVVPDATYAQRSTEMGRGDRIVMYTDGVVEAPSPDGAAGLFGSGRLMDLLARVAGAPLARIKADLVAALRAHTGGPLSHDDVTIMALELTG